MKATFCVTAEAVTAKAAGGVQVTPLGAVPVAAQVSVTVPVKELVGVRTRVTLPEVPALRVMAVEVLPLCVREGEVRGGSSGAGEVEMSGVAEALVMTWSWPVAAPAAVGVKTTLMAQVAADGEGRSAGVAGSEGSGGGDAGDGEGCFADVGESDSSVRWSVTPTMVLGKAGRDGLEGCAEGWRGNGEVADGDVVVGGAGGGGGVVVGGDGEVGVEVRVGHVSAPAVTSSGVTTMWSRIWALPSSSRTSAGWRGEGGRGR